MYTELGRVTLKSGQRATVARVTAPDSEWGERIIPFLGHKETITRWQVRETVVGDIGDLESYYYLAHLGDEVISTIATWEYLGAGILGHVFTAPQHRQKGACKAIMRLQMEDFRQRGAKALFLGTGFDTVPYYIYQSFGFESVLPGSGFMHYYVQSEAEFEAGHYARGAGTIRDVGWHDWAGLTTLCGASRGPHLRLFSASIIGRRNFEGGFIRFYHGLRNEEGRRAKVLEAKGTKAVVGVISLSPDERFGKAVDLLDLFVHPDFTGDSAKLLAAIELPKNRKVQAYVGADDPARRTALEAAGFKVEAVLKNQISGPSGPLEIAVLSNL